MIWRGAYLLKNGLFPLLFEGHGLKVRYSMTCTASTRRDLKFIMDMVDLLIDSFLVMLDQL